MCTILYWKNRNHQIRLPSSFYQKIFKFPSFSTFHLFCFFLYNRGSVSFPIKVSPRSALNSLTFLRGLVGLYFSSQSSTIISPFFPSTNCQGPISPIFKKSHFYLKSPFDYHNLPLVFISKNLENIVFIFNFPLFCYLSNLF